MIRIVLVEDQIMIREGLKALLEIQEDVEVVGEAGNGEQALQLIQTFHSQSRLPDIVLMDIRMPIMDGVTATQRICQQFSKIKILILTTFDDTRYIAEAIHFGAKGYVLKDTPIEELAESIRLINRGYTQFGPGILEKIAMSMTATQPETVELPKGMPQLTPREKEILRLIVKGSSNREIAQTLFLSEGTVRNHITHILTRLNVRDRTQAAIVATAFLWWLEK
jgi:DNA-binding NarL/FixJ family response regulator